jgi:hypothetical protein
MRPSRFVVAALAAVALSLAAAPAFAQATRTWISGVGDDVNPCSRTAPCKTFAGAISKTATGGEINAIDPGGFGAITITKSITLDGHGVMASILAAGTPAISVSAGVNDVVTIRGLDLNGVNGTASGGTYGVKINSAGKVIIEDCNIYGFTTAGIGFLGSATTAVYVKRTTVENNGAGLVLNGTGTASATIVKSNFFNDVIGLDVHGASLANVHDSVFSGNSGAGIETQGTSQVNMDHGLITFNGIGVNAAPDAGTSLVRLSEVMVGHNTTNGIVGTVASFGNNRIAAGNGTDGTPSSTLSQQ